MKIDFEKRYADFCVCLEEEGARTKSQGSAFVYLVTKEEDVYYLSGFRGDSTWLLAGPDCRILLTDSRYTEQARQQSSGWKIMEAPLISGTADLLAKSNYDILGFDPAALNMACYRRLEEALYSRGREPKKLLCPWTNPTVLLRRIKDAAELCLMEKACEIADQALKEILPFLVPGVTEKRLAAELEYRMALAGSEGPSFATIVASGLRGALPHGLASEKQLEAGDMVTFDFGAIYKGYHSDMTRTFILGRPTALQKERYELVLTAQEAAIEALAPGRSVREIDAIARNFLKKQGLDRYFGHGLGHSLGLEIHEDPRFSPLASETLLAPGMVMTVEPGVYLPEWGGLRIEDTLAITEKSCTFLTKFPKTLEDMTII